MNLLYVVGPRTKNEELRYSLRAAYANLPVKSVWVAGHILPWLSNEVHKVEMPNDSRMRWINTTRNLLEATRTKGFPLEFVLMNDDFFVMEPLEALPVLHGGPLADLAEHYRYTNSSYAKALKDATRELGSDALNYELHVPMPMRRAHVRKILESLSNRPRDLWRHVAKRTIIGNDSGIGGAFATDVKVHGSRSPHRGGPFLSTARPSFEHAAGDEVRKQYRSPSPFEKRG